MCIVFDLRIVLEYTTALGTTNCMLQRVDDLLILVPALRNVFCCVASDMYCVAHIWTLMHYVSYGAIVLHMYTSADSGQ